MDLAVESDSCILSNYSNKESYRNDDVKRKVTNFRCRNPTPLDRAGLGLSTFCAAHHPVESCGSNGLPLTPNSVQILGKFQTLSQLEHPNLCTYVEVCRIQHGMYIPSNSFFTKELLFQSSLKTHILYHCFVFREGDYCFRTLFYNLANSYTKEKSIWIRFSDPCSQINPGSFAILAQP